MITVVKAPFAATVQDLGRPGYRHMGVPPSGAMDRDALMATNVCAGNAPGAAAIEIALGGGELRFDDDTVIAIGGARLVATLAERAVTSWVPMPVHGGDVLRMERATDGCFAYLAVHGGIDLPLVLGSRSTMLSAHLGGRLLRSGDVFHVADDVAGGPGAVPPITYDESAPIPVVRGPQAAQFGDEAWASFLGSAYRVSSASNRIGYRFDGAAITHAIPATHPSEPTCVGTVQVPSDGTPIVLMRDAPTIGGYPKIAVVRERAVGALAQRAPGSSVRFVLDE